MQLFYHLECTSSFVLPISLSQLRGIMAKVMVVVVVAIVIKMQAMVAMVVIHCYNSCKYNGNDGNECVGGNGGNTLLQQSQI